ncbi:MAG: exodeoxyribonuclease VII large subunit [Gemmatimonadota bacterium]
MTLDLFSAARMDRGPEASGSAETPGRRAYSVSDVNRLVRQLLEGRVPPLWVAGEVTNWKRYGSGHCYFSLRDAQAQLRCVMFRNEAAQLPTDPEEGMKVRALGRVTVYEKRGDFQLIVDVLEGEGGDGLWRLAFERLRAKLEAEGLLAPERKRPLPRYPRRVGVVTSAAGAALHDILQVMERRAPWTTVVLCPARVQGDGAAEEVARALRTVGRRGDVGVVIVGRGGGSVEDLWAFNEEVVARAIAECPVPVVSAVGHEVDVTIADLVADLRAPTPSAAAEHVAPDGAGIRRAVGLGRERMVAALRRRMSDAERDVQALADGLQAGMEQAIRSRSERVSLAAGRLEALSPLSALARGYAVAQDVDGRVLRRASDFQAGGRFRLRVVDGRVHAVVEQVEREDDDG